MNTKLVFSALVAAAMFVTHASAGIIIDDFTAGVISVSHPEGAGVDGTWYDIANDAFGSSIADTLAASPAMTINDGGFTNGVYAIFSSVIPADGVYSVSVDMLVNDTATSDIANYQIGVVVNGVHRGLNPSDLAIVTGPGTGVGNYTGLTPDVLDATVIQNVTTTTFAANAGDNLLIAFGTSVDTLGFDTNAGFWNGASVLVDNIMLNAIPEPSTVLLATFLGLGMLCRRN